MRVATIVPFVLFLLPPAVVACSEDGGTAGATDSGATDSGGKDSAPQDSGATDSGGKDSGPQDSGATDSGPQDSGASSDSGLPRRRGQCLVDGQCGAGMTCAATAPGGLCNGCAGSCSLPGADQCNFGACNASCGTDADCPTGLRCNGSGTCVLKSCSADAACAPLHRCDGGFCRRISCAASPSACPAGTTCATTVAGKLCVEDNLIFP